jgi:hypothetical protein
MMMKNIATQLITQKFCKFFYLLACLAIFSNINASTTITFNDQDVSSVVTAFTLLQQRQTDDPIAQEIVAKSAQTLKGKVAALHQFNERLRKRQEETERLAAQGLSPVRVGEDFSSKLIAKQSREATEMQRKLQADMNEEREQQRRVLERKEKELKDKEDALAKIKDQVVSLVDKAAALSPLRKELAQERARDRATPLKKQLGEVTAREAALAAELKRLKSQMGGDVLETILEERSDSSDDGFASGGVAGGGVNLDGTDPIKLDLLSYYGKIEDIRKKLAKAAEVIRDCNTVEALLLESLALVVEQRTVRKLGKQEQVSVDRYIPDDEVDGVNRVDRVLALMKQAWEISNSYKAIQFEGQNKNVLANADVVVTLSDGSKKTVKAGEHYDKFVNGNRENMKEAQPSGRGGRVELLESYFELYYLGPIRTEKEAIEAIDTLQLSLDLTLNFEASILSTKKLELYSPSAFEIVDGIISNAIRNFRAEIIKQDRDLYDVYLEVLEREKDWAKDDTNFSKCPTILHLLRNPMVLFMFKRPAKKDEVDNERTVPFASFGRISDEIRYLTENQKKALFASLYFVVFNYEQVSGGYLRETLLSNTPIQAVDIHPLIKEVKESLKKNFQPLPFRPSTEQQDLAKFSVKVNDLLTGKTYREGITNRFASALISLGQKLDGISQEGIVEYLKTENLPEEKRTKASRILAEHEFISREALNQQLVNKQKAYDSYVLSLAQSISEKGQREEEARAITAELEEGTLAKLNAQREKKEKEVEIETFSKTVEEHNKEQLAELGQKYEQLNELENKLIILNKSLAELGKKSKKLTNEIELSTKKIQSLETNIEVIVPEIENLADALRKLEFVSELERLSDDIDGIASRGQELFDFNRTLESCFELLTDLQSSTKKLVEAEEATATGGTSSASKPSRAVSKLGSAEKSKIEAVLRKAGGTADSDLAAQNAKKLKAMALVAAKEKREADAQAAAEEKRKASIKEEDAPTEIFVAKKPARTALGGLVVTTAESLEQELLLIENQLALKQINEEIRRPFIERIQTIRGIIETPDSSLLNAKNTIGKLSKEIQKL